MKKYILLASVALAMTACGSDDNYIDDDTPVAVEITATIGESSLSRAGDISWANGDRIGVTMIESDGAKRYANMLYTTPDADGIFTGTPLYFKNKLDAVTLTAYYPFAGTEGTSVSVIEASTLAADQTPVGQALFDFLYDSKADVIGTDPKVKFTFSHKMSKLTLIFKNGNGADVSTIKSCVIEGLVLQGSFDPADGTCAAKSGVDAQPLSVDVTAGVVHEAPQSSLIIFPQTVAGNGLRLKITDTDGQEYACDLTFENNSILSGKNYLYSIKVNKTGLTVEQSTINKWEDKELDAEMESV